MAQEVTAVVSATAPRRTPVLNVPYYRSPRLDRLMDQARETAGVDRVRAIETYRRVQEVIVDDGLQFCLCGRKPGLAARTSLRGFRPNFAYQDVVFFCNRYQERSIRRVGGGR